MIKKFMKRKPTATQSILLSHNQAQFISTENTAIVEYLDVVKTEYQIERDKKQNFDTRAGLIITLLGAICIFLFEKINLKDIFSPILTQTPLTFILLLKILSGLIVYFGFGYTVLMTIKTINIKSQHNFEVKNINESLLVEQRLVGLCKIISTYRDIILQHRELNEKRAKAFKNSIYGISVTLFSIIIYISL